MYEDKIRDKFENFDNDFKYEGHYRDNYKKVTKIKLRCRKCNDILEKDQGNLLTKAKTLFCWNCEGKKKPQPLDYNKIINNFVVNGCTNLELTKQPSTISGICKCGDKFSKRLRRLDNFNYSCESCSYRDNGPHCETDVRNWLIDNGLTPTFDMYRNTKHKLSYICICGEESHIRYSRRFVNSVNWKPMCRKCAMRLKMSGDENNNWKGGKYGKRFAGEWRWSRNVKKKFGYKCCITGKTEKLVSHHLNALALGLGDHSDILNGVCITYDLHIELHSRYDKFKGTCTREDFEEFFFEKTNIKFNEYLKNKEDENKKNW